MAAITLLSTIRSSIRSATIVVAMSITLATVPAAAEEVYQWLEAGVVNYGKRPPEGVLATKIRTNVAGGTRVVQNEAPAAAIGPNGQPLDDDQQAMLNDLRQKESERQEDVARIREANCTKARDVLAKLTERGRIRVRGDDGGISVLPEDERQQRIEAAQEGIAANCESTT